CQAQDLASIVTGTLINVFAILIGGTFGLLFGARLPERLRQTVVAGLGLFTAVYGIQLALKMEQPLVVLGGLLVGGLLGEWWRLEDRLSSLGAWLEMRFASGPKFPPAASPAEDLPDSPAENQAGSPVQDLPGSRFIRGFLTASLLYAIGPMAILGSIRDGLNGDYSLLAIKSVLDGFASLAFASSLGVGVLFSSLVILVYQGGLSLLAAQANALITQGMMNEMTATGGILLIGIAISSLLEIKSIRVGNFLPALVITPLIVAILAALGLG
ncbi:MAG: DUF554 domain-containing protein, partial [Omnitrophica WOR_2 bacterium]